MAEPQLWPFGGAGDVYWQLEWLTDVLQASAGLAHHRQLRDQPRVRIGFDGLATAGDRRWLENLLERNGGRSWRVPLPGAGFVLAAPLPVGAGSAPGDTAGTYIRASAQVALVSDDPRTAEAVAVDDVLPAGIVLAAPTVTAHGAGTKVLPVFTGRLGSAPVIARFTGDAAPWRVEFDLQDPLPITADAGATRYRNWPVLELPVDWSTDPDWQPQRELQGVDYGTAKPVVSDLLGQSRPVIRRHCTAANGAEVMQLLGLLWALAGRAMPVWVHTQARDLVLSHSADATASTVDVQWAGLGIGPRPPGRRDLRIALQDGSVLYRRVTAVSSPNAGAERLTLDAALGVPVAPADVRQISWMALCTQSADVVRINWWRHDVAEVALSFQAVPHEH